MAQQGRLLPLVSEGYMDGEMVGVIPQDTLDGIERS